jgi:molybdopterin-guanine dinucleotide biosynthesis protein A
MKPIPVYLLAGGRSSRFGSDKARAELGGEPLILRLAHRVESVASPLVVVADRRDKYLDLGLTTIADALPGLGPLGGLLTAFQHAAGSRWTLVLSCDLLDLRPEWLEELEGHVDERAQAVVFRDQFWQPFPGLYHTSLLTRVEQQVEEGDLSVHRLLERAATTALAVPADLPLVAANTRDELEAYERGTLR